MGMPKSLGEYDELANVYGEDRKPVQNVGHLHKVSEFHGGISELWTGL